MRVAARAADAVAADAELLARSAVTPCARGRVDASLDAVVPATRARGDETRWVGAARRRSRPNTLSIMAPLTRALAVTGRAEPGIGAGLEGVARNKAGAMQAGQRHVVEGEPGGERGDRPDAMATCTRSLAVTARAEVACPGSPSSVLAKPVAVVNQVALGRGLLGGEILVTAVAVAERPLLAVLVATEARRHLGPQHLGPCLGDRFVTPDAVAAHLGLMVAVLEAQVLLRKRGSLSNVCSPVAAEAGALVVRLLVAAATRLVGRKVK